jgi:pimeloyl-ACP methyl ester carboxylesterase
VTQTPFADRHFTVSDGLRLHYRDYPGSADRPPLLCLHGLTRNHRDFAELAERLSPRFRVLTLDFRGRGDSEYDRVPERYTPLTYAADVLQLLDSLEIPQAVVVGTSLGGLVTMTVAALQLQRIAGAILNDVGPVIDRAGIKRIKTYLGRDVRFASWDEAADAIERAFSDAFPRYTDADWVRMAKRNCREEDGQIRFDYDMAIAVPFNAPPPVEVDLWPLFAALSQKPVLVVRGARSDLLTPETAERMRAASPLVQLATVPDVGHAPELNEPEAVAAIDQFLRRFD